MIKLGLYVALVAMILGAGYKAFAFTYEKGVADTEIAYKDALQSVKDRAVKDALSDWKAAQVVAGTETDQEIKIVTEIREIEREVPVYIDRIIEVKPDCAVLPELGELFTKQAEAANSRSSAGAENTG